MILPRRSLSLIAALAVAAVADSTGEPKPSCLVDVGSALASQPKTTDAVPLAEGSWHGDVYVLPYSYPGTYDRFLPGDLDNVLPRQWVAQSFLDHNPDAYDFIAVVTGFAFDAGWGAAGDPTHALYWGVRNDTAGIGLDLFDLSFEFGSNRLQGYIDANSLELVRDPDGNLDRDRFLAVLNHELGHRWLAYCDFRDAQGVDSGALRGVDDSHWSYLLDSDASYMYGADWTDNGDGSFTSSEIMARFSGLDLYLMGMVAADKAEPVTLLVNPSIPADQYPEVGATVTASSTPVTAFDVIAAEGPRQPTAADSPHELRIALVYLTPPNGQITAEELDFLTDARRQWQRRFFAQTEGRGVIGVGRNSSPPVSSTTLDLAAAVDWLVAAIDTGGAWQDAPVTRGRDSAAAVAALDAYGGHDAEIAAALADLASASAGAAEVEARGAEALARHDHSGAAAALDQLAGWVLDEGAWGSGLRYAGDSVTTARVVRALVAGGRSGDAAPALAWVEGRQNDDGGWPWRDGGSSSTAPTLEALGALATADPQSWGGPVIQSSVAWLLARRMQGGFGDPHPDAAQTALFLLAARGQPVSRDVIDAAVAFLAERQRSDGSWDGRVYPTALAVAGLAPYVQPDLAVFPDHLVVEPEQPFVDDQLTLLAAVHALNGDVAAGVPYQWQVVDASQNVVATLGGVLPPIPATLFATVADTWDLRYQVTPGPYTFRFTADPSGVIAEADESNNSAELAVVFRDHSSWIDLVLAADSVHATPDAIGTLPQPVVIDGTVRNTAWSDAHDAVIAVFDAGSATPMATTVATVPSNGSASFQLTVELTEARTHLLDVVADPDDLLGDVDTGNNLVELEIDVTPVFDPAVVPGSIAVTPSSGIHAGDPVHLSFELTNHGTEPVSGVQVGVSSTAGTPPTTTPIRLVGPIDDLAPGEVETIGIDWRPPVADPAMAVTVVVDPSQLLDDADRGNNTAETSFTVLPSALPNLGVHHTDIAFDPEPALQGDSVEILATVTNPSDNDAGPFLVRFWIDEIDGGLLAGEATVPGLAAASSATVSTGWPVDAMADRVVWVDVDADGTVAEFDEGDNRDFRVLDVATIPDLVVTSGQVQLDPRYPRSGDMVEVELVVLNTGDQSAADVELELGVVDGPVIGTASIGTLEGGGSAAAAFDWPTAGLVGDVELRVEVDPSDAVAEIDEDNNTVVVPVAVQDDDLWVSERFISPNGDGVHDSTTIFVREPVAEVEIVDPWGETVRTLQLDSAGMTVWDGRRADGAAVRDGVYEVAAGGLRSWVEVDLNSVAITDDVRQRLIVGNVPTTSSHWNARFSSYAASPVDGIVYLREHTGVAASPTQVVRWSPSGVDVLGDWPDGQDWLDQISAREDVVITRSSSGYSLLRFPGPQIDPLPPPSVAVDLPHLSPDGAWILWSDSHAYHVERSFVLQRVADLSETYAFGPYPGNCTYPDSLRPKVHWAPGSGTAVALLFGCSTTTALRIDPGTPAAVHDVELGVRCMSQSDQPPSTAVDFDDNLVSCVDDAANLLHIADLRDGAIVDDVALPEPFPSQHAWYRLSRDGRAVEVDAYYPPMLKDDLYAGVALFDWRRGLETPWFTAGSQTPSTWSTNDRFVYEPLGQYDDVFTYRTPAANLAVALDPVVRFGGAGVDLLITVTDRNLDFYQLEYAPAASPEAFEPLGQPSRETAFGANWGTWIPPSQGSWRVRLTAVDLAGNQRSTAKWVTWNGVNDIAGLWPEPRHISPISSPGTQDMLTWHYTVLRPAQLLFRIVDETDALVRSIPVGAAQPGPATTGWDGLDDAGRPVPDGDYRLVFRGAEWPVTVDNTPPQLSFEIDDAGLRPTASEIATAASWSPPVALARSALFNHAAWSATDEHLDRVRFETRRLDQTEWAPAAGIPLFAGVSEPTSRDSEVRSGWWAGRMVRQVATDRAGNRSVAERVTQDERLGFAIAEPPCRSDDDPCVYPERPAVDELGDADGLLDEATAVLWPDYSTLLVQSTIPGDLRASLRIEFRTPAADGMPAGDWQPGTLTTASATVWRRPKVLTGVPQMPVTRLDARVLPVYWEHPGLPMRPYEVRLLAENVVGDEIESPATLVVPLAPLAVEYLSSDAGGDHFRVHNIGSVRISDVILEGGSDTLHWRPAAAVGDLDPGQTTLVGTGCGFLDDAAVGMPTNWVRVSGADPWGEPQRSLPTPFERAGPPQAFSRPSFALIRGSCEPGSPPAMGMVGYRQGPGGAEECVGWWCDLGWYSSGRLVDLAMTVPAVDPNGEPVLGYELLLDGAVIAGAPELVPGTTNHVILDLTGIADGPHLVSERYSFASGAQGMLSGCVQQAALTVDRSTTVQITQPLSGQVLCPDQGLTPIATMTDGDLRTTSYLIDGTNAGVTGDPPSISVSSLQPGPHVLEVEVVDLAGNAACASVDFVSEGVAAVTGLSIDPPVLSPVNTSGRPTQTMVAFTSTAAADWTAEILDGADIPIQTVAGAVGAGGVAQVVWDGRDHAGNTVADGTYRLRIRLDSVCGATFVTPEPLPAITVDTAGPTVIVTNPGPGAVVGANLELMGMIDDPRFERWEARVSPDPPVPGSWTVVASDTHPSTDPGNVLARWPASYLPAGGYLLIVEASDDPGNRTVTDPMPFEVRDNRVIASFDADPIYVSPNGDGAADTVDFGVVLLHEAVVSLGYEGEITLIDQQTLPPGVLHAATWDGVDDDQLPVPDGPYSFTVDTHDPVADVWETEFADVIVDRQAPSVTITNPQPGAMAALPVTVTGVSADPHADTYSVVLFEPDGDVVELDADEGDWTGDGSLSLDNLPDGDYQLSVTAEDLAHNVTATVIPFTVDGTAPAVEITGPEPGAVVDASTEPLVLRGVVDAAHPDSFAWWIAVGPAPAPGDFVLVHEGAVAAGGTVEHQWDGPPPADGLHTLRLTVLDQLGRSAEHRILVTVDTQAPEAEIRSPADGGVVAGEVVIDGRVADVNIERWTLEEFDPEGGVRLLAAGTVSVDGELTTWTPPQINGLFGLSLNAWDDAGHRSEAITEVEVAVLPPAAPVDLVADVVDGRDVALSWQAGPGPVPVGYHVERNGIRITSTPLPSTGYGDLQLLDGAYVYEIVAVGATGRESDPSSPAAVVIDTTPPTVVVTSPTSGGRVGAEVAIRGTAFAADDFAFWEVAARPAGATAWTTIAGSTAPVVGGHLTTWTTLQPPWSDGPHQLRLAAQDTSGNRAEHVVGIVVDTTPPEPGPANLQATLTALDPDTLENDVVLTWSQSPTPDLAGFYLYRNGLLANAPGPVVGDIRPYLIDTTAYEDRDVPDGVYSYVVVAADTAGNVSPASGPAGPITVDVRRPHATIVAPGDGSEIEGPVEVAAECADGDLVSLELAYRADAQPGWTPIAPAFTEPPYVALFTPPGPGLFHIRALAADAIGPDPAPDTVSVTASDLPPAAPLQPAASVDGESVALTWISPPDPTGDLAGYEVERDGQTITTGLLPPETPSYLDDGLDDAVYEYRIAAVDQAGQRGVSEPVEAVVRTPAWSWLAPVTTGSSVAIAGGVSYPGGAVEITHLLAGGTTTATGVAADPEGGFELLDVSLDQGTNTFVAVGADTAGNTSRASLPLLVVSHAPPTAPDSLQADVIGSDVELSWNAAPDPDDGGVEIRRDGTVVNSGVDPWPFDPAAHGLTASGADPSTWPLPVDGNTATGWAPERVPTEGRPEWWSWLWPDPMEIGTITTAWSPAAPPQLFDVDVLTGDGWLWLGRSTWDGQPAQVVAVGITASGVRIRVPATGACGNATCLPKLTEVSVERTTRTPGDTFVDPGVADGPHVYEVRRRNLWGQWSLAATTAVAVGSAQPEPPTGVTVTPIDCGGLAVQWVPPIAQPGQPAGFRIYRSADPASSFDHIATAGAGQTSATDPTAPVGSERHYRVTALVETAGVIVESTPSPSASGTATCTDPPPPVITHPTVAGQPIVITPSQAPITVRGTALPGATVTLLRDGLVVASTVATTFFRFDLVDVLPGPNTFVARQELAGSVADSAPITVDLDQSLVPDIRITAFDIEPAVSASGGPVLAVGSVELDGPAGSSVPFDLVVSVTDPDGAATEVHRTTMVLADGGSATVYAPWTPADIPGEHHWRITADPDDAILELDEDNNTAEATSLVLADNGLELSVELDRSVYSVGHQLTGRVLLASAAPPQDLDLETRLEDGGGRLVAVLDSRPLPGFGPGRLAVGIDHPLLGLYPGIYRVRAIVSTIGTTVIEELAPFRLEQPIYLEASLSTDAVSYAQDRPVQVSGRVRNLGPTIVDGLATAISVVDETTGQTVGHSASGPIAVAAGAVAEVAWTWSSVGAPAGPYHAAMVVRDSVGTTVAVADPFSFAIVPGGVRLAAEVSLTPASVEPGDGTVASIGIVNAGGTDLGAVDVVVRLIDPGPMQVVAEHVHPVLLAAGASDAFEQTLDTTGLALRRHVVLVSAEGDDGGGPFDLDLASSSLDVGDLSPPSVVVLEPSAAGVACSSIQIAVEVTDAWSRIDRVYHQLDDEPTAVSLHLDDPSVNPHLYSASRPLPPGPDAAHTVTVVAEDAAGNVSCGTSVDFDVDTAPPTLQVTGPADGSCVAGGASFAIDGVDPHLTALEATLDGAPYAIGSPIWLEGPHLLEAVATDACDRTAAASRSFVVDDTPPDVVVNGVSQGADVEVGTVVDWTVADATLVSVTATLDGAPVASPLTLDVPGPHTLRIIADDCAGNLADLAIQFTVTASVLSIGGTASASPVPLEPGEVLHAAGTATNLGSALQGVELILEVVETSTSTVVATATETVDLDPDQGHTIAAGLDTTGWALGDYQLRFAARGVFLGQPFDLALDAVVVAVADLTPPQLTPIGPSPGLACGQVEVVAEAIDGISGVRAVTVSVDGGAPVPLDAVNGNTWSTALTLDQGAHTLQLIAVDHADNATGPVDIVIDLDSEPPELTVTAPDDGACIASATSLDFSAVDPHLDTVTGELDGIAIQPGHVVDDDGPHQLTVSATDLCGRDATDQRTFTTDRTEPEIAVAGVDDGDVRAIGVTVEWSASDDNLVAADATLDGAPIPSSVAVDAVGRHVLEVSAEDCAGNQTGQTVPFETVLPADGLSGSVTATPLQVEPPTAVDASGTAANLIDDRYPSLRLRLELVDPSTGAVLDAAETTADLAPGADLDLDHEFSTDGLQPGGYLLRLVASGSIHGSSFATELVASPFDVVDLTAPTVTVLSPASGLACDPVEIIVELVDAGSGIGEALVHVDGDPAGVPLVHDSGDLWRAELPLEDGAHTLELAVADIAGNDAPPVAIELELDLTPPVLTVGAPVDSECLGGATTVTFGAEDAHLVRLVGLLDGVEIASGTEVSAEGAHQLRVTASDGCGRSAGHGTHFVIDTAPPTVTVSGVGEGDELPPPVVIEWTVEDDHLDAIEALLDGEQVASGVTVTAPGSHLLEVDATDCAGNHGWIEFWFDVVEGSEGVSAIPPSLTAGGSILLLDRAPVGGAELASRLTDLTGRVTRVTDGCSFLDELRRNRHELAVLYAPTGAIPLALDTCSSSIGVAELAAELAAVGYGRAGLLVVGDGMEGEHCLGCLVAATGTIFGGEPIAQLEVVGTTLILDPGDHLTLVEPRPVTLASGFPLLVGGDGGPLTCDGVRSTTLELTTDLTGRWQVSAAAATPLEPLDAESGHLDDGDAINLSAGSWADLGLRRTGETLSVDLVSNGGGALPDWLALTATVSPTGSGGAVFEASAWIPIDCTLEPSASFGGFRIASVDPVGHRDGQTLAGTARRWGRAESLVLPWDVLEPANADALAMVEQALRFTLPGDPWPAVTGLPLPITFGVVNGHDSPRQVGIEAAAPPTQLLEVWNDPVSVDPVRWELEVPAETTASATLWLQPTTGVTDIEVPYQVRVLEDGHWVSVDSGVVAVQVETTSPEVELRELRSALGECAGSTDDPTVLAALRDLLAALDGAPAVGPDRTAINEAIERFVGAFAAIEAEALPCQADLRARLSRLVALWQGRWIAAGSAP